MAVATGVWALEYEFIRVELPQHTQAHVCESVSECDKQKSEAVYRPVPGVVFYR